MRALAAGFRTHVPRPADPDGLARARQARNDDLIRPTAS